MNQLEQFAQALDVVLKPAPRYRTLNKANFDARLSELFEKNQFDDGHGDDGFRFETYGADEEYVRKVADENPDRVCTMLDCDGVLYIARGFHYVNRFGYFVAKAALPEFTDFRY